MKINAFGDKCPIPVIKAKNALNNMEAGSRLDISVDNATSAENLAKLAVAHGYEYDVFTVSESHYDVSIVKTGEYTEEPARNNTVVCISSEVMGEGSRELGAALMKSFIYVLTELKTPPKTIIFYNGGAKITTEGSKSIEDLKKLEKKGTEVLTCGACMDYFGIKDKLAAGSVSNMYTIVEKMITASHIIKP